MSDFGGFNLTRGGFDQNRTMLAGIPRATLLQWQTQLQACVLNMALAKNPQTISYSQHGNEKSVTFNITSVQQAQNLLMLVNRALGYEPMRRPMRPYFL